MLDNEKVVTIKDFASVRDPRYAASYGGILQDVEFAMDGPGDGVAVVRALVL